MVQIDPGGALASNFRGADPEALIFHARSKDDTDFLRATTNNNESRVTKPLVVEAIESRHIVDELRDDGGDRYMKEEPSSHHKVIDLTANRETSSTQKWPTPNPTIVESKDVIITETLEKKSLEERDYTSTVVQESGEHEPERDTTETPAANTTPSADGTDEAGPEATKTHTEIVDVNAEAPAGEQVCGSSVISALFACIDPTYGYQHVPQTTSRPPLEETVPEEQPDHTDKHAHNQKANVDELIEMVPVDSASPAVVQKAKDTSAPTETSSTIKIALQASDALEQESQDDDSRGEKLLEDLASVPSVQEDLADSVSPMKPEDLATELDVPSSPSGAGMVEENSKAVESSLEEASQKSGQQKEKDLALERKTNKKQAAGKVTSSGPKQITPTSSTTMEENLDARRRILTKELKSVVSAHGRYDLRCANVSAALGDIMDEARDHGHATKLHQEAVSIYSCKLGDDHSTTLKAKMRLGRVLENAGDIEQAINLYYQVTVMRKALRGEKDESVGDGLVCMARALRKKEDYIQAIKELKRALKIFRHCLGDSDDKVSSTVDDIASLYITIGDFAKAAAILEEVVKLKAATVGPKSNQVGTTLLQLASAYECAGEQHDAVRSLKKAYKIFSEIGGHSGKEATTTLNRMAMLYGAIKDHNRAAVAFLGVLRSRKIHYGVQHTAVGETYFHLGRTLRLTTQYDKALKCLKEALPIFVGQGAEVDDVKMVADIMHEMAMVNQDRGNHKDAARIFKQEISVRRKIGQPSVPFISRSLLFMGIAEFSMKNYNQALKHLVEALALLQERGDEGLDCAKVLYYTGLVFEKVDNRTRAVEALAEAIRLFEDNDVDSDSKIMLHAQNKVQYLRSHK